MRNASLLAGLLAGILPATALAYVGPGAGLTAIGTGLAIIAAFLLAIVGFIWYPVKRLLGKKRQATSNSEQSQAGKDQE